MARQNYQHQKRQRDLARQKKQEEKRLRKANKGVPAEDGAKDASQEPPPENPETPPEP